MGFHGCPYTFEQLAGDELPRLHQSLMASSVQAPMMSDCFHGDRCTLQPVMACYVFFEMDKALYVGITKNLRTRLQQHTSADPTRANLVLRMAAQALGCSIAVAKRHSGFAEAFSAARERLLQSTIAYVEVGDSMTLYLLEPYIAMKLDTQEFNRFDTLQILRPSHPSKEITSRATLE